LRQAIAQPGLCAELGMRGRRLVEREFSLDAVIRDTLAVYAELVTMPVPRAASDRESNVVPLRRAS
jgi:hypothetical protein